MGREEFVTDFLLLFSIPYLKKLDILYSIRTDPVIENVNCNEPHYNESITTNLVIRNLHYGERRHNET